MESIEETNTVGESTDLYQVVTGEAHQVGAGETRKRVQIGGETVGLQPRHGLLRGRASHKTSLRATAEFQIMHKLPLLTVQSRVVIT